MQSNELNTDYMYVGLWVCVCAYYVNNIQLNYSKIIQK
jgi:hypothetical protein